VSRCRQVVSGRTAGLLVSCFGFESFDGQGSLGLALLDDRYWVCSKSSILLKLRNKALTLSHA
jgi:hypothetical protein